MTLVFKNKGELITVKGVVEFHGAVPITGTVAKQTNTWRVHLWVFGKMEVLELDADFGILSGVLNPISDAVCIGLRDL
jgi:hypothetical protein